VVHIVPKLELWFTCTARVDILHSLSLQALINGITAEQVYMRN